MTVHRLLSWLAGLLTPLPASADAPAPTPGAHPKGSAERARQLFTFSIL